MQPNSQQIDPTALTLSRAIRSAEGGDYNNYSADNGTAAGAYSWSNGTEKLSQGQIPKNFQSAATQFGLNPNDFSSTNQDHVAYEQIKSQLDAGHSQSQVAAWWNSGGYDPSGKVGYNASIGKSYNVPEYVSKVQQAYTAQTNGMAQLPTASSDTTGTNSELPGMPALPQPASSATSQPNSSVQAPPQFTGNLYQDEKNGVPSGLSGLLNSIEKPFVGLAATPVQLLAKTMGQPDPYAQGIPEGNNAPLPVSQLGVEQKLGDAAQVGSYFVPGTGILGAAGMGALQGAGSAMSEGKDLPTVATQGTIGGILGAGTAGLTKLAGSAIEGAGNVVSGQAQQDALDGIKDAYSSALNLNAGERAYENRSGNDLAQVLMDNSASLGRYEDGTLDATKALPVLQSKLAPLDSEAQNILGNSGATINLIDAGNAAKQGIATKATTALDRTSASSDIDQYIQAEVQQRTQDIAQNTYGQAFEDLSPQQQSKVAYDAANPTVAEADKIKQGFWNATFNKTRSDLSNHVPYQIGTSMKDAIESAVPDSDLAQVNSERGDLIDSVRRLQKMDGVKLLKGGRLGNIASGAIGALTGTTAGLGPLGPLAGDYFGQKAGEFLQDPATKLAIAQGKYAGAGLIPSLLGNAAKPIGNTLSALGQGTKALARPAGLLANLLTQ